MPGLPPGMPQAAPQALDSPFQYLSPALPAHYQLLDVAASTLKKALGTGGFRQEPEAEAGVMHLESEASQLIANYARKGKSRTIEAPAVAPPMGEDEGGEAPDAELENAEP